jgi:hypothetical protein
LAAGGPATEEAEGIDPPAGARVEPRITGLEELRHAARAETAAFLAILDACAFAPPSCAALLRAWHALASLDALLRGAEVPGAAFFEARLRSDGRNALCRSLAEAEEDFVRSVFARATGDPWSASARPTDGELRRHRRLLLGALASLEREARRRIPFPWRWWRRGAGTFVVAVVVVMAVALSLFRSRWRVSYFANPTLSGEPVLVTQLPTANQNWGFSGPDPRLPVDGFSARFESCLRLSASTDVEFSVGSDDGSRLFVDDQPLLAHWTDQDFTTRIESVSLAARLHRVRLEYYDRSGAASLTFGAREAATGRDLGRSLGLPADASGACAE